MPGSAFIRHTVNNGTARSDDSEAERAASSKSYLTIIHKNKKKDKFKQWFFFPFLVQRCFVAHNACEWRLNRKWWRYGDDNPFGEFAEWMKREREREREKEKSFWRSTVCIIDEIKILRHVTIQEYAYFDFEKFFLLLFLLFLIKFIPHRTKFPASPKQRSDKCKSRGGRSDRRDATRTITNLCNMEECPYTREIYIYIYIYIR